MKWTGWVVTVFFLFATGLLMVTTSEQAEIARQRNARAVAAKEEEIRNTLKGLQAALAQSETKLEQARKRLAGYSSRIRELETRVAGQRKQKAQLLRRKQELETRLAAVRGASESDTARAAELREAIDLEKTRIQALKAQLARIVPR